MVLLTFLQNWILNLRVRTVHLVMTTTVRLAPCVAPPRWFSRPSVRRRQRVGCWVNHQETAGAYFVIHSIHNEKMFWYVLFCKIYSHTNRQLRFKYVALYVVQVLNKNSKEVLAFKENSFHDQFCQVTYLLLLSMSANIFSFIIIFLKF